MHVVRLQIVSASSLIAGSVIMFIGPFGVCCHLNESSEVAAMGPGSVIMFTGLFGVCCHLNESSEVAAII